jgi:hypothetical protein
MGATSGGGTVHPSGAPEFSFFLHYYLPCLVTFVKVIPAKMIDT